MSLFKKIFTTFITLLVVPSVPVAAEIDIQEWQVPYENSRPRDPFVDAQGRVWFCGQAGAYLAYLVPETGEFKKYDLDEGVGPHNLIIDSDGFVWFAANTKPFIGKLDPDSGDIVKYPMPEAEARDPHTLVFDSKGDIWFTLQTSNAIGKLETQTGKISLVYVPVNHSRPYGIKVGPDDRPWIVLFGTNRLASVDPDTMELALHDLPRKETRPRRLEISEDGNIWYVDYNKGKLGRLNPANGAVSEWQLPGGEDARPYGTALDDRETIWVATGSAPNRLVRFDLRQETFMDVTDIPNATGSVRHMYFHPPSGEIWFGEDSNYIGRARVP